MHKIISVKVSICCMLLTISSFSVSSEMTLAFSCKSADVKSKTGDEPPTVDLVIDVKEKKMIYGANNSYDIVDSSKDFIYGVFHDGESRVMGFRGAEILAYSKNDGFLFVYTVTEEPQKNLKAKLIDNKYKLLCQ